MAGGIGYDLSATIGARRLIWRFPVSAMALAVLAGCGPSYSPDTYASNAAQQANKVEQGVVVGVRNVGVTAAGTVGTITGAAAGGIAGSQAPVGALSAFTALGGSLVGGIAGATVEHATADTAAFEYIVRKPNGDLVSVTQKDKTPLALGQKVLVIGGNQARVVPDYTLPPEAPAVKSAEVAKPVETAKPLKTPNVDAAPSPAEPSATETRAIETKPVDIKPADAKPGDVATPKPEGPAAP
jgi:outer membrane lipoprotein SlyB